VLTRAGVGFGAALLFALVVLHAARFRVPFVALRTLARGVSDSPEASGSGSAPRVLGMCRNMAAPGGGCPRPGTIFLNQLVGRIA
jgi:hypothetical protein